MNPFTEDPPSSTAPSRVFPPVPPALKWAVTLGTIIPATIVGLLTFVVLGLGDAWSSSPYSIRELIALAIGAFILALAVLCYLSALLWHGVRGIRPVFLIIFAAPALLVGFYLPVIALSWILLAGCLLYNCSVSDFLRACRTVRSQLSQAEPQPRAENTPDLQDGGLAEHNTETPSPSRMEEGAIPKSWRPGCGCLCLLAPYYLIGLSQLNCIYWPQDRFVVFAYALAPFLWPVMAAGWLPGLLKIPVALAALYAYGRWLRRAWKADSKKTVFLNILWLFLLFILSIGGCLMEFDRSFEGVN